MSPGSRRVRTCAAACLAGLAFLSPWPIAAQGSGPDSPAIVRVSIADDQNLQWMNFWVALGAGHFADEGLDVEVVLPRGGAEDGERANGDRAVGALLDGSADFAVLPRPLFLIAVSEESPVLAVANLLANEPINLVVQGDIAAERGLSATGTLAERLESIRGLRVGVAGGPISRLRVLFAAAGMDSDRDIETVVVPGGMQNAAFAERRVDALFAHTPYLETALEEQGGVLIVDLSAGDVPELAGRQIHMLVTTRQLAAERPELALAMTRATYRAQHLIHTDRQGTLAAIRSSGLRLQAPAALEQIVEIYSRAIPESPAVSTEGAQRELALFPGRRALPDLSGIAIEDFVDNRFAIQAIAGE